ncbi:MAG: retron system putative HNH endonuclease [Desulfobacteraceae bacterium]|jgi:uncharacterized protein (TIGR02646 family)
MKYVLKGLEPLEFSKWKGNENENWKPEYSSMGSKLKNIIKISLIKEQGFLCCYCQRRLYLNDSHIEHFNPQCKKEVDPLDYSNMLCSCQNQLESGEPRHCGNLKGDWYDSKLLVSPFNKDCENQFEFYGNGEIAPFGFENTAAETTIEKLGLNIPKLIDLRKKAIEPFLEENLDTQELKKFVKGYLKPDSDGKLGEFYTVIESLFMEYTWI